MRWLVVLVVALATFPTALAAPVQGQLVLDGIRFDEGAVGHLDLHALYSNDTSRVTRFELTARTVELRVWWTEGPEVRLVQVNPAVAPEVKSDTRILTDARIALAGDANAGWLGVRWVPGADATLDPRSAIEPRASSEVGTPATMPDTEDDDKAYFMEPLRVPHLLVTGPTGLRIEGNGSVRLSGLDLDIESRENRSRLDTGVFRDDAPVGNKRVVWATLTFMDGAVAVDGLANAQAQALAADLRWSGAARLRGAEGDLHGEGRDWLAAARDETLDGAFQATLAPGERGIRADLAGDLDGGTLVAMTRAPAPAAQAAEALPWLLLGLGVLVGGAATYGVARARAHARHRDATPEDLLDLALQALEAGDHERALAWVRRARRLAPASERLMLEEAAILDASGDAEGALKAYRAIAEGTRDAEACWHLARGLARAGAHPDDVAPWVAESLARDPILVFEVEEDEALAEVATRPDVKAAVTAARASLR